MRMQAEAGMKAIIPASAIAVAIAFKIAQLPERRCRGNRAATDSSGEKARAANGRFCEGLRMPAFCERRRALGSGSESLQGTNPRDGGVVPALWGFDGSAWSAVGALMRLTGGTAQVDGRAGSAEAAHDAVWRLKSGRFRCGWAAAREAVHPGTIRSLGRDDAR